MRIQEVIFNTIDNGIIILDENLRVIAWNAWLEIKTDILSADIIGKNIIDEFSYINEKKLKRKVKTVLVTKNQSFYSVNPHKFLIDIKVDSITNNIYSSMQQDITIAPYDLEEKMVCLYIYDKTSLYETNYKLEKLNNKLIELSNRDHLTKVYNRRYFAESSEKMLSLAIREKNPLGIISLDIDFFKKVNDKYGHSVGDEVLVTLAKKLEENIRQSDIVARFGGEEFVILTYNSNLEVLNSIAEKIRNVIENLEIDTDKGVLKITASFGIAIYEEQKDNLSIESVLKRADDALYLAKNSGRNQVKIA